MPPAIFDDAGASSRVAISSVTSWLKPAGAGSASADALWCAALRMKPRPAATSEHCWHVAHRPASVSASHIDPMVFTDRPTGIDRVEANSASVGSLRYTDGLLLSNPKKEYLLPVRRFNKGYRVNGSARVLRQAQICALSPMARSRSIAGVFLKVRCCCSRSIGASFPECRVPFLICRNTTFAL